MFDEKYTKFAIETNRFQSVAHTPDVHSHSQRHEYKIKCLHFVCNHLAINGFAWMDFIAFPHPPVFHTFASAHFPFITIWVSRRTQCNKETKLSRRQSQLECSCSLCTTTNILCATGISATLLFVRRSRCFFTSIHTLLLFVFRMNVCVIEIVWRHG